MTRPKAIKFLDLPYEIHALIFKYTLLNDAKALALTCRKMYTAYNEIDKCLADKIIFNSKRDNFKTCTHLTSFKEIILDYFISDASYDECIELCLRQKRIEKIKLYGLIYDGVSPTKIFVYPAMEYLTELELKFVNTPYANEDYLLPFIQNTTTLRSLKLENIILSTETMDRLSKNENLNFIKLENVFIFDMIHFRLMLTKMKQIQTFLFFYFRFTQLMNMVHTIEAIFECLPHMKKLQEIKITVWQELNITNLHDTVTYIRQFHTFRITKGNAASFIRAVIPLINSFRLTEFELLYFNRYPYPNTFEKTSIRYNISDQETRVVKLYNFTTE